VRPGAYSSPERFNSSAPPRSLFFQEPLHDLELHRQLATFACTRLSSRSAPAVRVHDARADGRDPLELGAPATLPGERELKRVQAKVGELTMKLEIVEWFLEKKRLRGRAEEVEGSGSYKPGRTSATR